ncbi:MAG: hypothetical protein GWP63_05390 [Haliea sp.]|jgi:hypothetical protein|nr:hypothetical protein [Haliea sp.]
MWRPGSRDNRISNNSGWILLAAVGLVLALVGARIEQPHDGTGETLAWVNERPVTRDQLGHAQRRLNRGGGSLAEAELRSVINMLIDEELLLQRAETLGVVDTDPGVRKAIVQASIDRIVDEFSARPVGPGQLEKFYRGHQAVFARPDRVVVAALRFDGVEEALAARAAVTVDGSWAALAASPGAQPLLQLPGSPLPAHVLRRYLGPGPAGVALSLAPGEISQPVKGAGGFYLLQVTEVIPASLPRYEDIVPVVRQEYLSRGREVALTRKLAALWQSADVQLNPQVAVGHPGQYAGQERP